MIPRGVEVEGESGAGASVPCEGLYRISLEMLIELFGIPLDSSKVIAVFLYFPAFCKSPQFLDFPKPLQISHAGHFVSCLWARSSQTGGWHLRISACLTSRKRRLCKIRMRRVATAIVRKAKPRNVCREAMTSSNVGHFPVMF